MPVDQEIQEKDAAREIRVAALYQFTKVADPQGIHDALHRLCMRHQLRGTLLIAPEGINGTVAGSPAGIDALRHWLRHEGSFTAMEFKQSSCTQMPFHRMKVKVKREIVSLGVAGIDPTHGTGRHLDAQAWNQLIRDPEVLMIDTRNDYEVELGSFKGAINPKTSSFHDFPAFIRKHREVLGNHKIAMFCTGGIRCEKASAYLLENGFDEVYQLHGGILRYLQQTDARDSLWRGECFVFDDRVSVDAQLRPGSYTLCPSCQHPVSKSEQQSPLYQAHVCCARCHHSLSEQKRARMLERQKQIELASARGEQHIGMDMQAARTRKAAHACSAGPHKQRRA